MKHGLLYRAIVPLLCCALLLAGCQSAASQPAQSAPDSASRPASSAPTQPEAYTGPLYEISVGELSEKLPGFYVFRRGYYDSIPCASAQQVKWRLASIGISEDVFYAEFGADLSELYKRRYDFSYVTDYDTREESDAVSEANDAFAIELRARILCCAVLNRLSEQTGIPVETLREEFGQELAECCLHWERAYDVYYYDYASSEERYAMEDEANGMGEELLGRIEAFAARQGAGSVELRENEKEYAAENGKFFGFVWGLHHDVQDLVELADFYDLGRPVYLYLYAYSNSGDYIKYQTERDSFDDGFDEDAWEKGRLINSRLEAFPELDAYIFFGTSGGRTVLYDEENDRYLFADGSGNILYTAPENLTYVSSDWWDEAPREYEINRYAADGMFPFADRDTGELKYLNMDDFGIVEIDPEYSVTGYTRGGTFIDGGPIGTEYRDGRKAVIYAESTDTLYYVAGGGMDLPMAELDAAGYIDKTGEFVFKFCDLPQFEGQIVIRAGEYYNGTAIVQCRPRTGRSGQCASHRELFQGTFYEIDKEGNILRECTEEDYWDHSEPEDGMLHPDASLRVRGAVRRMEDFSTIPAERILLKDDLVLYKNESTGGFEMMDVNGTVYPIEAPEEIFCAHVMGNGLVTLSVLETSEEGREDVNLRYYVQYEDIRPEDLAVDAQGFEPQAIRVSDYYAMPE